MVTWLARYRALKAGDLIMATPIDIQAHMTKARNMGLENSRVPNEYCTSTEYYKGEQQMIFRRAWLMIGRVKVVENVGDYIVRDMPMLEANVIITHEKDGKIRALHNACSYPGVALVCEERGNALTFRRSRSKMDRRRLTTGHRAATDALASVPRGAFQYVRDDEGGAFVRITLGSRRSKAARAAGIDCSFALKSVHIIILCLMSKARLLPV